MGKDLAKAAAPFQKKRDKIAEMAREYRLRASLGKDADGKMAILKEFSTAVAKLATD